jgi:hypothetical protein
MPEVQKRDDVVEQDHAKGEDEHDASTPREHEKFDR